MSMRRSEAMASLITAKMEASGGHLPPEVLEKMSQMPSGGRIRPVPGDDDAWPVLLCERVFVLPGVPEAFATKLTAICAHFLQGREPVLSRRVLLAAAEETIVEQLNAVVAAHQAIAFGSYPVSKGDVRTIITLESEGGDEGAIEGALAALLAALPETAIASVDGAVSSDATLSLGP